MKKIKNKSSKKFKILDIFFLLVIISGILLLIYPFISDYSLGKEQKSAVSLYNNESQNLSEEEKAEKLSELEALNKANEENGYLSDPFTSNTLDLKASALPSPVAIINIPKINLIAPIYPNSTPLALEKGIGVLEGSSLPMGGEGSHSILTGHRGLSLGKMFTDLPVLKIGDKFFIQILDDVHAYEVDNIETVLPDDFNYFKLDSSQDLITLVTCTPLGSNTHRLLVRGHRIPYEEYLLENEKSGFWTMKNIMALAIGLLVCILVFIFLRKKLKSKY